MAYCEVIDMGGPFGKAFVRFSGRPPAPCEICSKRRHTKLCDYKVGRRKTCDRKLCDECSTHVHPDLDYCPEHKHGEGSLFSGPTGFFEVK